jgi:hypothetical protein
MVDIRYISTVGHDFYSVDECVLIVWNGTGVDDVGGDWEHSGHGFEASYAKYNGTNGLDATELEENSSIMFSSETPDVIEDYDLLTFMLNIKSWQESKGITIDLYNIIGAQGIALDLEYYADLSFIDEWQKIYIPLEDFGFSSWGISDIDTFVDRLNFVSSGNIDIYLDDIQFGMGQVIKKVYGITTPEVDTEHAGDLNVKGEAELIGVKVLDLVPTPNMDAQPGGTEPILRDIDHLVPGLKTSVPIP